MEHHYVVISEIKENTGKNKRITHQLARTAQTGRCLASLLPFHQPRNKAILTRDAPSKDNHYLEGFCHVRPK